METCEAAGCSYHANAKAKIVKCVTQENHFYIAAINEQRKQLRIDAGAFADPDLTCAGPCRHVTLTLVLILVIVLLDLFVVSYLI